MNGSWSPSPLDDEMMMESSPSQAAVEELNRKSTVECRAWDKLHLALRDAGIFGIPSNFQIEVRERRSGLSKGDFDFYYFDRDNNRKFRSQREAVSAILANQELLCSSSPANEQPVPSMAAERPQHPDSPFPLGPCIKQQEAEARATGPSHPGQQAWLTSGPRPAPDQPPLHRSIKIKFKIKDPLGAAAAGSKEEQQQATTALQQVPPVPAPALQPERPVAAPALKQSPAAAAAQPLQQAPPTAAPALKQSPTAAAAPPLQQAPPVAAPTLKQSPAAPPLQQSPPPPRPSTRPTAAVQQAPPAAPALQQLPPVAPLTLRKHSGAKLRLVVAPRKAAKGAALKKLVVKAKDCGVPTPPPLNSAAPRPQRIVLKKSKLSQPKQRAGLGCINAAALELLVAAALGQQDVDMDKKEGPAGEGQGSDPGSGSATDVAPVLRPSREPLQPAVLPPASSVPAPEAHRGARASYRKRFRGQTAAGPGGQHGALPSARAGSSNGSGQVFHAPDGPGMDAGISVSGEACEQALHLLRAALPGLLGAVQVVQALKTQGIGGAPFDGLAGAVEKVQAACRHLQG